MQSKTGGKSAGRVQSVALKLIVDREDEINSFVPEKYFTITAFFNDFEADIFKYKTTDLEIKKEEEVKNILSKLNKTFNIEQIEKKEKLKKAKFPFTTSTLQQEASTKLGFTGKKTMSIAQKLYEGIDIGSETTGLISYMRTDSVRLSDEFVGKTLNYIEKNYGKDYIGYVKKVLEEAHRQTGLRAVVLVDEYDKPLLDVMDTGYMVEHLGEQITLEEKNRNMLRAFYSTFKGADKHLQFVFLTGVTKFSQVSVFSDFNQPNDISMSPNYDTICGITDEELEQTFLQQIEELAAVYGYTGEKMRTVLKKRFDGYHFSKRMKGVYNPFSILNTFDKQDVQDYWFRTGTPTYLVRLLNHFDENLDELTGKYYMTDQFVDYRADKEKPLPMIFQSGYLTIKDYDSDMNTFMLDYPNDEVKRGFVTLMANNYLEPKDNIDNWIVTAISALRKGNLDDFQVHLTAFLSSIPYTMRRKDSEREKERYFHYTFYLLLRLLSTYTVYTEKVQSQGRVDCIVETSKFIYIFEFKLDGTAQEALLQINNRGYAREYANDKRKLFKIGCSFSSETGTIEDWKIEG